MELTYRLEAKDGQQGITCLICNKTSWNPGDVDHKYCGNCKKFHSEYNNIDHSNVVMQFYIQTRFNKKVGEIDILINNVKDIKKFGNPDSVKYEAICRFKHSYPEFNEIELYAFYYGYRTVEL